MSFIKYRKIDTSLSQSTDPRESDSAPNQGARREWCAPCPCLPGPPAPSPHLHSGSERQRRRSSRQLEVPDGSAQLGAMVLRRRCPQPRSEGAHGHSSRPCAWDTPALSKNARSCRRQM